MKPSRVQNLNLLQIVLTRPYHKWLFYSLQSVCQFLQSYFNCQQFQVSNWAISFCSGKFPWQGWIPLSLPERCDRTASIPVSEESTSTMNWLVCSERHRTGAERNLLLCRWMAASAWGDNCVLEEISSWSSNRAEISDKSWVEIGKAQKMYTL